MKTDYPELENKKVVVINYCGKKYGIPHRCIVVGCNYHVGISIVDEMIPEIENTCINRKSLLASGLSPEQYRALFYYCIQQIKEGVVYGEKINNCLPWYDADKRLNIDECAFKQ